jgi:hypothetical protein
MSFEAVAWVKAQYIPSAPQKLIMVMLAERMSNDTCECFPGQALLAEECSMSERALRDHLPKLEEARFLERRMRFHPNGERKTDAYTFPGFQDWLLHQADSAREYGERARKSPTGGNLPVAQNCTSGGNLPVAEKRMTAGGNLPRNLKKNPKSNIPPTPQAGGERTSFPSEESREAEQPPQPKPKRNSASGSPGEVNSQSFEQAFRTYPGSDNSLAGSKLKAWREWQTQGCEAIAPEVIAGVRRYAEAMREEAKKGRTIKKMDGWLRDRRWERGKVEERPVFANRHPMKPIPVTPDVAPEERAAMKKRMRELRSKLSTGERVTW